VARLLHGARLEHACFLGLLCAAHLFLFLAQQAVFLLAPRALRGLARLGLDLLAQAARFLFDPALLFRAALLLFLLAALALLLLAALALGFLARPALGFFASAQFAGSTAIGTNATTTAANQVALGGAGSSVRVGDIQASTAAQNGAVQMVTVDANGVLGRAPIAMEPFGKGPSAAEMIAMSGRMGALENQLDNMQTQFRRGIAATVAMTPVQIPSAPGKLTYALNGSAYRGQYATGGSMMYRLNTSNPMAVGMGFSYAGNKETAVRFGIAGEF